VQTTAPVQGVRVIGTRFSATQYTFGHEPPWVLITNNNYPDEPVRVHESSCIFHYVAPAKPPAGKAKKKR
jgi:hypothetical protein